MRRALDVDLSAQAEVDPEFVKPVPEKEKTAESDATNKKDKKSIDDDDDDDDGYADDEEDAKKQEGTSDEVDTNADEDDHDEL